MNELALMGGALSFDNVLDRLLSECEERHKQAQLLLNHTRQDGFADLWRHVQSANNRQGKVNTHTTSKNKDVTKITKAKGKPTYKAMLVHGCGSCISTTHAPAISSNNRQAMLTHSKYTQYSPCRTCVPAGT